MVTDLAGLLARHRLLAIVRGTGPDAALATVLALAESGIAVIEVSLTTPGADQVIAAARAELGPGAALGAGTVLGPGQVDLAAAAGASYLVTPAVVPEVAAPAEAAGLPLLMGAFTPTEATTAMTLGAAAIKLFPAAQGGPAYVRALRDPFPALPVVPVGGVTLDQAPDYLAAGAIAVGAGSPLVGDAASGGDLGQLRSRARAWRERLSGARAS